MNIYKFAILCLFLLLSCAFDPSIQTWYEYEESKIPSFDKIEDACYWLYDNISYKSGGESDFFRTADEILELKEGDCEDIAILLMAIIYKQYRKKATCIFVKEGNNVGHVVVKLNSYYYDTRGKIEIDNSKIKLSVPFDNMTLLISTTLAYKYMK